MTNALIISLIGITSVFIVIIILEMLMFFISWLANVFNKKLENNTQKLPVKKSDKIDKIKNETDKEAKDSTDKILLPEKELSEEIIVAIISAIITNDLEHRNFIIKSIKEIPHRRSLWRIQNRFSDMNLNTY